MSKYLQKPWEAKWAETLDLSKRIVAQSASLAQLEMELTLPDTFTRPQIRSVFKGEHGSLGFSVVKVLVTRFVHSFAFSTKLSEDQLEMLTVDTLENFAYESLEDIILFFKMARAGKLGSTKRGVDANLIFGEWFPLYLEKKAALREEAYHQQKQQHNAHPVSIKDVQKTYADIQERNRVRQLQAEVDEMVKDMDRQLLEDAIIHWQRTPELRPYVAMLKRKRRVVK